LEGGNTAEPSVFTVEARNKHNERVNAAGVPIDVTVISPEGVELNGVTVNDNGDGTFDVEYQPEDAGTFTVNVILRNKHRPVYYEHIKDSPFKVNVEPGTDANKTIAYGPGLEDGIPDTLPTHFTIEAKDKYGNRMEKGGDPFEVKITGPNGEVPAQVTDNGDGTYTVNYEPTDAGKHRIDVTLKDKPISNSPYHVNVKEGADDEHSCIEGFTFTIRAKTKANENKKDGGDDFRVVINDAEGNDVPDVKLKDIGDGTYFVSYKLPGSGEYNVHVLLNGKHIKGSPWKQNI
jgi:filamin